MVDGSGACTRSLALWKAVADRFPSGVGIRVPSTVGLEVTIDSVKCHFAIADRFWQLSNDLPTTVISTVITSIEAPSSLIHLEAARNIAPLWCKSHSLAYYKGCIVPPRLKHFCLSTIVQFLTV